MIALVLLATSFIVLAEDEAQQTLTNLDYNSVKQYLDQITSKVWFGDDFFGLDSETLYLINKFVQAIFWIAKFLFKIFAGIYEILSSANGLGNISDLIRTVIQEMSQVFSALKDSFLLPAGIMMASYAVYVFFVKNGSFVKTLLKLLAVFAFSGILFTQTTIQGKSGYVAEILYDTVETVTAELSGKVTSNLTSIQSGQTAVLDQYFLNAIWTPYSHMNGEDKKGQVILTDDQLKRLVFYNDGDDDFEIDGQKIEKIAGNKKKAKVYGLKDSWGVKFSYAFVAIIETFVMGVIVDGFAIFAFVMKLVFILIVFLSPVAMLLSLIPTFENILFNVYKRMLLSLGISGSMAVISTLFLYFYNKLGEILTAVVGGNIILGTVLKAIVLFILWKKRDWLISILTANRVTSVAQNWVQNLPQLNTQRQVSDLEYEGENDDSQRISRLQKGNWKEWLKNKVKPREQVSSDFDGSSVSASDTKVDVELIPQPIQRPSFESSDSSPSFVEEPSLKSENKFLKEMSTRLTTQTETGDPMVKVKFSTKSKSEGENFSKEYHILAQNYLADKKNSYLNSQLKLLDEQYKFISKNTDIRTTKDPLTDTLVSRLSYYRLLKNDSSPVIKYINSTTKPSLNKKLVLAAALFVGLFLGIFAAFVKDFSNTLDWKDIKSKK